MAHEVFISYSVNDKQIADRICSALEAQGTRCWIAPRDILPGTDWGGSIIDAITASRMMILVLSSSSNTSPQVKREVERAVNKNVIILPFRIENLSLSKSLEYHLSSTHWLDASTPPIEKHLETLTEKTVQILSGNDSSPNIIVPDAKSEPAGFAPFLKWPFKYIVIGLFVGLAVFAGSIWLFVRNGPSPDPNTNRQNQNGGNGQLPVPVIFDKTYDEARKILIEAGWAPNKNPWAYGEDPQVKGGNGPVFWKREYWELTSCSRTASRQCVFEFIDPSGRKLAVVTEGEEGEEDGEDYHAKVIRSNLDPR